MKNGYIVYAQYNHYHNSLEIPLRIPNPIQKSTHFHYIAYNNIINYIIPYINPIISIFSSQTDMAQMPTDYSIILSQSILFQR